MTTRYLLLLVVCTTLASAVSARQTAREIHSTAELVASTVIDEPTQVWLVFRASDCTLSADLIEALNTVDRSPRVRVTAIMIDAPERAADSQRLARELGIRFAAEHDVNGEWKAALRREKRANPSLLLRENGNLLGEVSPAFLQAMARLSLSSVRLERLP